MNQEAFQARHEADWTAFERWLDALGQRRRTGRRSRVPADEASSAHRYRVLCHHLALARERQYSPGLVARLNALVMRGHQALYGAHADSGPAVARFFASGFARAVRSHWRPVGLAAALFFIPLLALGAATALSPDVIHALLPQEHIAQYEAMYDPAGKRSGRGAQADTAMLGYYIWNNIRIGFQTFAGGMLFGLGSVFFLVVNGVLIGAIAGHLIRIGSATPFMSFVAGHSAFELTGIVLMGAAGLLLGKALVLPGAFTRGAALRRNARAAVPLVCGGGTLLALAAFIEAFWSPLATVAPVLKYAVGTGLWLLLAAYFLLAGRPSAD